MPGIPHNSSDHCAILSEIDSEKNHVLGRKPAEKPHLPIEGFMAENTLKSLFESGYPEKALEKIEECWGKMLDWDATTCWERLDLHERDAVSNVNPSSHCHAWSAGPAYLLPAYILGVQPEAPGFKSVRIQPCLASLNFAEGTVPLPEGELYIRIERSGSEMKVLLNVPESVEKCRLILPGSEEISVQPGTHRFTCEIL